MEVGDVTDLRELISEYVCAVRAGGCGAGAGEQCRLDCRLQKRWLTLRGLAREDGKRDAPPADGGASQGRCGSGAAPSA